MSTTTGKRLIALTSAALLGLTGAAAVPASAWAGGRATAGAAGIGDRLYPLLGNGGYDVQNYDLTLTYPRKDPKQTIRGDVTITAIAAQRLSRFNLDFGGGAVGAVSVNDRPASFRRSGDELIITPKRSLPAHRRFTVRVAGFTATPIVPDDDAPAGFVTTPDGTIMAGQPDQSHKLFPSNDHPRDLATYTFTVTAPAGWTATASGRHVRTRQHGGFVTSTYRESHPLASELIQIAVGDFVVRSRPQVAGVPIRDVVPRRLAGTLLPKAADERNQMTWLVKQLGRYPFDSYGTLVIDGELGFALETQTLSLFDTWWFDRPQPVLDAVSAHELAHQWFGDSVAPYEWSDVWQSEGHATWYELTYALASDTFEEYTGHTTLDSYFEEVYASGDRYRAAFGAVAHPLKADEIWDVFNPNVYDGGALVLFALRQKIGAATFAKLERAWVTRYRGRPARTRDFIALASQVSGQDLRGFLNDWLFGTTTPPMPGHPDWKAVPPSVPAPAVASLTGGGRAGHR
jgi:aminopeptidase N